MPVFSLGMRATPATLAAVCLAALCAWPATVWAQTDGPDSRDPRDVRDPRYPRDPSDPREVRDPRDPREQPRSGLTAPMPLLNGSTQPANPADLLDRLPFAPPSGTGAPSENPALEAPLDPDTYTCGRGDVFELNFWGPQNFKQRVVVDVEGRAFIPKVGYLDVRGKTLTQARALLRKSVLRFYPGISVDLSLLAPRTFLVHVVDNVGAPGSYEATALDRVAKVLRAAGGIRGSIRRVEIRRRDGTMITADLLRYALTGETASNPMVMDGDVIRVPNEGLVATVSGPVYRPGRYELTGGKDLAELIELAGGLRSSATRQLPIRLLRRDAQERSTLVELPFGEGGALPSAPLHDDDEIEVQSAEVFQQEVLLVGAIAGANAVDEATSLKRVPYLAGDTVRSVIDRAGGLNASADLSRAYIQRGEKVTVPLDLEALLTRRDLRADRRLELGDSIVVPYQRRSVLVEGAVVRPGSYPYNPNFKVEEYIAVAGGIGHNGQGLSGTRRITAGGQTAHYSPGLMIQSGDTIVVPERGFTRGETAQIIIGGVGILLSSVALVYAVSR